MAKPPNQNPCCNKEKEEPCFHIYEDHLKRLQGGDFMKPPSKNKKFPFKYPSRSEIAAFLNNGPEGEKKSEDELKNMQCCLDRLSKENDCLRKENTAKTQEICQLQMTINEKDNVIQTLTTEIECDKSLKAKFECEKEQILKENDELCCQLKVVKRLYANLKKEHNCCAKFEDIEAKESEIRHLADCLKKKEIQLECHVRELKALQEKNRMLVARITSLEEQMLTQYDQFRDKSCAYQKSIEDLERQIEFLEKSLGGEASCPKFERACQEIENHPIGMQESYNAEQISERDRLTQELLATIELRDRNLQNLARLKKSPFVMSDKEYNQLTRLTEEQGREIDRLSKDLQKWTLDGSSSKEDLLHEVWSLQNEDHGIDYCDQKGIAYLERRVRRLKCKIKSRLQREEARRKELSRQLGIYRCQFVTLQKEIEELRQGDISIAKDEITERIDKEKELTHIICHVTKLKRDINAKYESLSKALINTEKVIDVLMNMS